MVKIAYGMVNQVVQQLLHSAENTAAGYYIIASFQFAWNLAGECIVAVSDQGLDDPPTMGFAVHGLGMLGEDGEYLRWQTLNQLLVVAPLPVVDVIGAPVSCQCYGVAVFESGASWQCLGQVVELDTLIPVRHLITPASGTTTE